LVAVLHWVDCHGLAVVHSFKLIVVANTASCAHYSLLMINVALVVCLAFRELFWNCRAHLGCGVRALHQDTSGRRRVAQLMWQVN
jgi:hypothetical protein